MENNLLVYEQISHSFVGINVISNYLFTDADDEGIERDSEDIEEDKHFDTKDLDHVLQVGRISVDASLGMPVINHKK